MKKSLETLEAEADLTTVPNDREQFPNRNPS